MSIPKFNKISAAVLELLSKNETMSPKEFEVPLAKHFNLTDEEIALEYDSGNGRVFYNRCTWALSYLNMAGLVEKPKRGVYKISAQGLKMLQTPEKIEGYVTEQEKRKKSLGNEKPRAEEIDENLTPQEEIEKSSLKIKETVCNEILDVILSKTPREFEKLVLQLLESMGYGGEIPGASKVTQYSNDGGIDGIIKEDILGLGRIHVQAKRYAQKNSVGREEIQKFVGALATGSSRKGIFITTSSYSKGALEYAESLNGSPTLVLIDGETLAEYFYDYGLGMQIEQTIEIKKLDSDFWDALVDEAVL
ncbi:MAG TPA: restriction endonuclease [Synergistaceae bacterium]|nr:restriction endonuclease [Synergistaceae bacterium]